MKRLAVSLVVCCLASACGSHALELPSTGDAAAVSTGDDAGAACPAGSVTFQLTADANQPGFFIAEVLPACWMSNWLKVYDSSGVEQPLIHPVPGVDCTTCTAPTFSSVCGMTSTAAVHSATWTWDGTYFAGGVCGPSDVTCVQPRCAAPGHYVVAMCAANDPQQSMAHRCVDVKFDYPAAGAVMAVLPAAP